MATSCVINDYVRRARASLLFTESNFENLIKQWDVDSQMLTDLQSIALFKGYTKWSKLEPFHWRLLITNTFNNRDKGVDPAKHYDDSNTVVSTLYFLLMGLIYCLQQRTTAAVDSIRVMRVSELDVTFEFTVVMISEEKKKAPPKPGLSVIVDNTDK